MVAIKETLYFQMKKPAEGLLHAHLSCKSHKRKEKILAIYMISKANIGIFMDLPDI